jgi:hypothetical protein
MTDALRRVTAITVATEAAINMARNSAASDDDIAKEWERRFFEVIRAANITPAAPPVRPSALGLEEKSAAPSATSGSDTVPKDDPQNTGEK